MFLKMISLFRHRSPSTSSSFRFYIISLLTGPECAQSKRGSPIMSEDPEPQRIVGTRRRPNSKGLQRVPDLLAVQWKRRLLPLREAAAVVKRVSDGGVDGLICSAEDRRPPRDLHALRVEEAASSRPSCDATGRLTWRHAPPPQQSTPPHGRLFMHRCQISWVFGP